MKGPGNESSGTSRPTRREESDSGSTHPLIWPFLIHLRDDNFVSDDDFDFMNVVLLCLNCGKAFPQHCVTDYYGNFLQFITVIFTRKFLANHILEKEIISFHSTRDNPTSDL